MYIASVWCPPVSGLSHCTVCTFSVELLLFSEDLSNPWLLQWNIVVQLRRRRLGPSFRMSDG